MGLMGLFDEVFGKKTKNVVNGVVTHGDLVAGRTQVSMRSSNGKNKITVNGRTYMVNGNNVSVVGDKIYVDGKLIDTVPESEYKETVKIQWEGELAELHCSSCEINGNVNGDVDATTVKCGSVTGSIDGTTISVTGDVGGDVDGTTVTCGNVEGDIDASTVTCKDVRGDIDANSVRLNSHR